MPEYTHPVRNKSSLPDTRHVEIRDENGSWIPKTLKRRVDYVGGKGYEARWQTAGTLEGFSAADLNSMYKSGTLRIVKNDSATKKIKRKPYVRGGYDPAVGADLMGHVIERNEESGKNADIRKALEGLNDFQISFEEDTRQHVQKLIFFRGSSTFFGSLPFYFEGQALARRKAALISSMTDIDRVRGVVGNANSEKHMRPFVGSISIRCEHSFAAKRIGQEIAELCGHTGEVYVHNLGHSAKREINFTTGVRETKRRVGLDQHLLRRAS